MDNMLPSNMTRTSFFTQKKIVIAVILFLALIVVAVGAFYFFGGKEAFDVYLLTQDETELAKMEEDLEVFSQDSAILSEIDQTFGDVLNDQFGISTEEALDETSIAKEASQADFGQTLNAFAADEVDLQELDQVFGEVSQ